jgi:fumarate hydratase class II
MMSEQGFRTESDSMGELQVPAEALYGAQTQRAVDNFAISGLPMPRRFIQALGRVKASTAQANQSLGDLDAAIAGAITQAAERVAEGEHDAQFPVDVRAPRHRIAGLARAPQRSRQHEPEQQ